MPLKNDLIQKIAGSDATARALNALPQAAAEQVEKKPAEVLRRAQLLDQALAGLDQIASNDPSQSVRDAAKRLADKAKGLTTQLNGTLWDAMLKRTTLTAPDGSLQLRTDSESRFNALVAVAGDRFGTLDKRVFEELEQTGQFSANQRASIYLPARVRSYQLGRNDETFTDIWRAPSTNLYGREALAKVGPAVPTTALMLTGATAALGALAGPVSYLLFTGAQQLGVKYAGATRAQYGAFGSNLLEEHQHPLAFLADRVRNDDLFKQILADKDPKARITAEIGVVDELLAVHKESFATFGTDEMVQKAEQALNRYRGALDKAVKGSDVVNDVEWAREGLKASVSKRMLKRLDELVPPTKNAWSKQDDLDLNAVLRAHARGALFATNLALGGLVGRLEKSYGVEQRVADAEAGTTLEVKKLTAGEIDAIRLAAGDKPSLYEVMGLVPLVRAGLVQLKQIWPDDDTTILVDGKRLQGKGLYEALDELRPGHTLDKLAEVAGKLGPWVGAVGAGITTLILGWTIIGNLAAIAPYLAGNVGGIYLGGYLAGKAAMARAEDGSESVLGRPTHDPFALVLERWNQPDFLTGSRDFAATLKREADTIEVTVNGPLEQVKNALAFFPPETQEALKDTAIRVGERLLAFAGELRVVAEAPPAQQRTKLAQARAQLLGDQKITSTVVAGVLTRSVAETGDPLAPVIASRLNMLRRVSWLIDQADKGRLQPVVFDLLSAAQLLAKEGYKTLPKGQRPSQDALKGKAEKPSRGLFGFGGGEQTRLKPDDLDLLAAEVRAKVDDHPLEPLPLPRLKKLVDGAEEAHKAWLAANKPLSRLTDDEIKATAEGYVNDYWTTVIGHLLPQLDQSGERVEPPSIKLGEPERVAENPTDPDAAAFKIKGSIGSDGGFEIYMTARGLINVGSPIQWDRQTLEKIALAEARGYLDIASPDRLTSLRVDAMTPGTEGAATFKVVGRQEGASHGLRSRNVAVTILGNGMIQKPTTEV
jgi:hypothetical protein